MKFVLVINYIQSISHHDLLLPLSSKDKDYFLKGVCQIKGALFADSSPEPIVKGKVFVNQCTSHLFFPAERALLLIIFTQLHLQVNRVDSVFTAEKSRIPGAKLLYLLRFPRLCDFSSGGLMVLKLR